MNEKEGDWEDEGKDVRGPKGTVPAIITIKTSILIRQKPRPREIPCPAHPITSNALYLTLNLPHQCTKLAKPL
jgi:hypothetical protein